MLWKAEIWIEARPKWLVGGKKCDISNEDGQSKSVLTSNRFFCSFIVINDSFYVMPKNDGFYVGRCSLPLTHWAQTHKNNYCKHHGPKNLRVTFISFIALKKNSLSQGIVFRHQLHVTIHKVVSDSSLVTLTNVQISFLMETIRTSSWNIPQVLKCCTIDIAGRPFPLSE